MLGFSPLCVSPVASSLGKVVLLAVSIASASSISVPSFNQSQTLNSVSIVSASLISKPSARPKNILLTTSILSSSLLSVPSLVERYDNWTPPVYSLTGDWTEEGNTSATWVEEASDTSTWTEETSL